MYKKWIAFVTVYCVLLLSSMPFLTVPAHAADDDSRFNRIYAEFDNPNGRVLTAAHRGCWSDSAENSLSSIQHCMDLGIDIAEIDVQKTKDGALILMHDETVDRTTNGTGRISDLTLAEIRSLYLKQGLGGSGAPLTNERVPLLEEAMSLVKGKMMVNLDKGWTIREDVYRVLQETGTVNHGIFKSSAGNAEVQAFMTGKSPKPEYMQVITDSNVGKINEWLTGVKPKAYELVFGSETSSVISNTTVSKIKGVANIWVNAMVDSQSGGHSDGASLINPENGWGWLINHGTNMIQTDYPAELLTYLQGGRSAFSRIEAESYSDVSGAILPEKASEGFLNLKRINDGSYVGYSRMYFGSDATAAQVSVASATYGGTIDFVSGSPTGPSLGRCQAPNTGGWQTWTTVTCNVYISAGIQDIYLKFSGGSGGLFNVNWFEFYSEFNEEFEEATAVGWHPYGGAWSVNNGKYTAGRHSAPAISIAEGIRFSDLTYEAEVQPDLVPGASGILFRAGMQTEDTEALSGYFAGLSTKEDRLVLAKVSGNEWTEIVSTPLQANRLKPYRIKAAAVGSRIQIYVDDMTSPKLDVNDTTYAIGHIGVGRFSALGRSDQSIPNNEAEAVRFPNGIGSSFDHIAVTVPISK